MELSIELSMQGYKEGQRRGKIIVREVSRFVESYIKILCQLGERSRHDRCDEILNFSRQSSDKKDNFEN
jgi:hypothetical protein